MCQSDVLAPNSVLMLLEVPYVNLWVKFIYRDGLEVTYFGGCMFCIDFMLTC